MLSQEVQTSSASTTSLSSSGSTFQPPQPLLRFVEYDFVPWEDETTEQQSGANPVPIFPGSIQQQGQTFPLTSPVTELTPISKSEPQISTSEIPSVNTQTPGSANVDRPLKRYSTNRTHKVSPAIRKRTNGERSLDKDYKLLKELSDTLAAVPGLEKIRWQSILQNTRGPEVGERETQRRVKEAELLGTRLFGGDIRKLLTSVLNAHLDFLVKYVSGTLSTSKRGHKKVRDQLWKVLLECKLKAEKDAAEGKVEDEEDEKVEEVDMQEEETGMNLANMAALNGLNGGLAGMPGMASMTGMNVNGINMNVNGMNMNAMNMRMAMNMDTNFKEESS